MNETLLVPSGMLQVRCGLLRIADPITLRSGDICYIDSPATSDLQDFLYYLGGAYNEWMANIETGTGCTVPEEMQVTWNGHPLYGMSLAERARDITIIHENPELSILGHTVLQEFLFSFAATGKDLPATPDIRLCPYGLERKLDRRTEVLSGGERHRLNCACAFEVHPKLLVVDFTASNLDNDFLEMIIEQISEFVNRGGICVLSGLSRDQIYSFSRPILYLKIDSVAKTVSTSETIPPSIQSLADETSALAKRFEKRVPSSVVVLEAKSLRFPGRISLPFSISLKQGELHIMRGANGIGKTTVARIIAGMIKSEDVSFDTLTIESTAVGLALQHAERTFVRTTVLKELGAHATRCSTILGLTETELNQHPRQLARGRQKLLAAAVALSRSDRLCILDEPTCGMDFPSKCRFIDLLNQFKELAILMITHDPALAF